MENGAGPRRDAHGLLRVHYCRQAERLWTFLFVQSKHGQYARLATLEILRRSCQACS